MMRRGVGRFHALIIAMLLSRLTLGEVQRKKRENDERREERMRREEGMKSEWRRRKREERNLSIL
jgi:hypothetical protein